MRIENQAQSSGYERFNHSAISGTEQADSKLDVEKGNDGTPSIDEEVAVKLDLSSLKAKPDSAKTPYEKDEQKKLEKLALAGNSRLDPDQYDMVKRLEHIEREVIMHENAHQATGGSAVGAASYQYTMGPDYRYYATGGSVEYNLPINATPESMIRAFKGLKRSAMSSNDSSGQDRNMAAMAEAKIQDIKEQISSDRGKLIYYEEMLKKKTSKEHRRANMN